MQVSDANGVIIRIGNIHLAICYTYVIRFGELRDFPVAKPGFSRAEKRSRRAQHWTNHFDFMVIRVSNVEHAVIVGYTERMLQSHPFSLTVNITKLKEIFPNDGRYVSARIKAHRTNS